MNMFLKILYDRCRVGWHLLPDAGPEPAAWPCAYSFIMGQSLVFAPTRQQHNDGSRGVSNPIAYPDDLIVQLPWKPLPQDLAIVPVWTGIGAL
jgi:hypothetical protein